MARIRMIKPEFFDDPDIADLSPMARLFFIGLWTQADREGRLVDDMKRLKVRIFPYDDVDVEALAGELHGKDMIRRYKDGAGCTLIWVRSFLKHQRPHLKETKSVIAECQPKDGVCREKVGRGREKVMPSTLDLTSTSGVRSLESGTLNPLTQTSTPNGQPTEAERNTPRRAPLTAGLHEHRSHASCGRVCVPASLHEQWIRRLGGEEDVADAELRAWYPTVLARFDGQPILGADDFAWWRNRFDEWKPAPAKAKPDRFAGVAERAQAEFDRRQAARGAK